MTEAQFLAACKKKWPDKEVDRSPSPRRRRYYDD